MTDDRNEDRITARDPEMERRDMRSHYDFSNGVRGKYAQRVKGVVRVVTLDPDVAAVFVDSRSVNRALRRLIAIRPQRRRTATRESSRRKATR